MWSPLVQSWCSPVRVSSWRGTLLAARAPLSLKTQFKSTSHKKQTFAPKTRNEGQSDDADTPYLAGIVTERLGDKLLVRPNRVAIDSAGSSQEEQRSSRPVVCSQKTQLNREFIVPGDRVLWLPASLAPSAQTQVSDTGVVHKLLPRSNILQRPGFNSNMHKLNMKNIAANIDLLCVVVSARPMVPLHTIDHYLAYAEIMQIPECLVVVNKADLEETQELFDELQECYQRPPLAYRVIETSVERRSGIETLLAAMHGKTTVFVGQSGVGKSSLINELFSLIGMTDQRVRVGDLVKNELYGAHTTSNAKLYEIDAQTDTFMIDSPGVRELSLMHVSKQDALLGFKDLRDHAAQCQFRNCDHAVWSTAPSIEQLVEDDDRVLRRCAIVNKIHSGDIDERRYNAYKHIVQNLLRK